MPTINIVDFVRESLIFCGMPTEISGNEIKCFNVLQSKEKEREIKVVAKEELW